MFVRFRDFSFAFSSKIYYIKILIAKKYRSIHLQEYRGAKTEKQKKTCLGHCLHVRKNSATKNRTLPNIHSEARPRACAEKYSKTSGKMCGHNPAGYISPNSAQKQLFYLVGFRVYLLKYNGCKSSSAYKSTNYNIAQKNLFSSSYNIFLRFFYIIGIKR